MYVIDASALLDYCNNLSCITMFVRTGRVTVVVTEVHQEVLKNELLTEKILNDARIAVTELNMAEIEISSRVRDEGPRGLKPADRDCFAVALNRAWTLVTNDQALLRYCDDHDVTAHGGLRILLVLVQYGSLSVDDARAIAAAIIDANPWMSKDLIADFDMKLRTLWLSRRRRDSGHQVIPVLRAGLHCGMVPPPCEHVSWGSGHPRLQGRTPLRSRLVMVHITCERSRDVTASDGD